MTTIVSFIIFIFVLFLYIHITAHYKKSEDLEIYESDYTTNRQLQEICDIRQPVLFDLQVIIPDILERNDLETLFKKSEKSEYETHVKDSTDICNSPEFAGDSILLPFHSAYGLVESDMKSRFYSENNMDFINEIGEHSEMDELLKPLYTLQVKYDMLFGSDKSYTTCRYHQDFRRFLFVKNGKIQIKMTPWKSRKYLYPENDYVHYEFRSPIDVWNPQDKYKKEMENTKFLEFEVNAGFVLYIPPFWFYSIKFINGTSQTGSSSPATVESYTYNSIMNVVSNVPQIGMYYLQQYNTTNKVLKKKNFENNEHDEPENIPLEESNQPVPKIDEISEFDM
jgi:hypothetical protein